MDVLPSKTVWFKHYHDQIWTSLIQFGQFWLILDIFFFNLVSIINSVDKKYPRSESWRLICIMSRLVVLRVSLEIQWMFCRQKQEIPPKMGRFYKENGRTPECLFLCSKMPNKALEMMCPLAQLGHCTLMYFFKTISLRMNSFLMHSYTAVAPSYQTVTK